MYNAKEHKLNLNNKQINYITFGKGTKPLIMILAGYEYGLEYRGAPFLGMAMYNQ